MRGGGQGRERGTYLFWKWLIMCSWHFLQLNILYRRCTRQNWYFLSHIFWRKKFQKFIVLCVSVCVLVCRKCKIVARSIWKSWSCLQRTSRFRFVRSENREPAIYQFHRTVSAKKLSNIIRVLSVFILTRQPLTPTTHFFKLVNCSYTLPFKIEF